MTVNVPFAQLKSILKSMKGSQLFDHWHLNFVLEEDNPQMMYDAFQDAVPVQNHVSFMNTLRAITGNPRANEATLLSQLNLLTAQHSVRLVRGSEGLFPVSVQAIKNSLFVEKRILSGDVPGIPSVKGKLFHIFEKAHTEEHHGMTVYDMRALRVAALPWFMKHRVAPALTDIAPVGKSKYQRLHAFIDQLEHYGHEIDVLMVRPQVLNDIALFLSQREGRHVLLKKLCPHLRVLVHYGERLAPYRKNLEAFLEGLSLKYVKLMLEPSGLIAFQSDGNRRGALTLYDDMGVFYEFVPEADLKSDGSFKRHYRRLHQGQVITGESYCLVVSNSSGLLGYNTGLVMTIVQNEPLRVAFKRMGETIDLFGENISLDVLEDLIYRANDYLAGHQFNIREYMIGDDIENKAAHWVFELSCPLDGISDSHLQSVSNMLHNEMSLKNRYYRDVISSGQMPLPHMTFLPLGTISTMEMRSVLAHMDLTEDAARVVRILAHARDKRTFRPESV